METILKVQEIDYDLVANIDNHERFVYMYSKDYKKVFGCSIKDSYIKKKTKQIEGFLKITNKCGKKIYRRFRSCKVESGSVYLGYRSMGELGLEDGDTITVEPTSWWKYYTHNSDSYIKYTVIIAIVGVICSILSCILAIIQIILSFV